jgi:hypothetical protein
MTLRNDRICIGMRYRFLPSITGSLLSLRGSSLRIAFAIFLFLLLSFWRRLTGRDAYYGIWMAV